VVLIRTDVSEDRIASIFRVNEYEQVQSETVSSCVLIRTTRCHLPEDDNHHSHRHGNLKSYNPNTVRHRVDHTATGIPTTRH
jgi:hypothetical protein